MADDEGKYTIGQMAKLCNVSTKQLRFYDKRGLVTPAYRDEVNGYRYYERRQIEEILLLTELKQYAFSLEKIGGLLRDRELNPLRKELEQQLYELRKERKDIVEKYDAIIDRILDILHNSVYLLVDQKAFNQNIISIQTFPKTVVAYTRYVSYWHVDQLFISRRAELFNLLNKHHLEEIGANMALFHDDYKKQFSENPCDKEGDLEVCIRIKNSDLSLSCVRLIEEFQALSCIYVGPYRNMLPAYLEMENYARQYKIPLNGESLEEYLIGASMTSNPNDYVTRLYLPLAEGYTSPSQGSAPNLEEERHDQKNDDPTAFLHEDDRTVAFPIESKKGYEKLRGQHNQH